MNNANAYAVSKELRTLENIFNELQKLNERGDEQVSRQVVLEDHIMSLRSDLLHSKRLPAGGDSV